MVKTPKAFIEAKGVAVVAGATNRTEGAVRVWKTRNRFPREAWLELHKAFPELTLEVLERMATRRAKPREEARA